MTNRACEPPLGIGLVGAGRIGQLHARNIAHHIPGARLVAVADVRLEAAEACAEELGIPLAFRDYTALLSHSGVDAVVICSSTDTHTQIIEAAAAAGKHIFCEKPIDVDLARIGRALAAVAQNGVKLQVGFNRRFDPSFRRVRDLVASGTIGEPHIVRITSRDPSPPPISYVKVSGGIFLDMTIHDFDMARFLVDREIEEVYAAGGVLVDPAIGEAGDVDTAVVMLRYEGGVLAVIDNSRRAVYGYDQRVEVFGSGGSVAADNSYPNTAVISDGASVRRDLPLNFFVERYASAYIAEMSAFIECVQRDLPAPVSGADGRAAVVVGLAAQLSVIRNRPVPVVEMAG